MKATDGDAIHSFDVFGACDAMMGLGGRCGTELNHQYTGDFDGTLVHAMDRPSRKQRHLPSLFSNVAPMESPLTRGYPEHHA